MFQMLTFFGFYYLNEYAFFLWPKKKKKHSKLKMNSHLHEFGANFLVYLCILRFGERFGFLLGLSILIPRDKFIVFCLWEKIGFHFVRIRMLKMEKRFKKKCWLFKLIKELFDEKIYHSWCWARSLITKLDYVLVYGPSFWKISNHFAFSGEISGCIGWVRHAQFPPQSNFNCYKLQ